MNRFLLFLCLSLLGFGCGDSATGDVAVQLSGEEAAQVGFPVGDIVFIDGWSVDFERILVSITEVHLQAADGDDALVMADPIVADLTLGEPEAWRFTGVPARRWDRVSYVFAPAAAGARAVGGIDAADLDAMVAGATPSSSKASRPAARRRSASTGRWMYASTTRAASTGWTRPPAWSCAREG